MQMLKAVTTAMMTSLETLRSEQAWNEHMMELLDISRIHTILVFSEAFWNSIAPLEDGPVKSVLTEMCQLRALCDLKDEVSTCGQWSVDSQTTVCGRRAPCYWSMGLWKPLLHRKSAARW